ncbi:MAG: CAP domain-containing protein [Cyanobacteria bacterium J007]|nr:MAG: CAP domain-containing protein [Cyanobacteria bacterium J007]
MAIDIYAPSEFDNLEPEEVKLFDLVNEYRAENGLPAIRLSKALTLVANRHVLDLAENIGRVTHDWSDASFSNNPNVMWNAPQRFNTDYPGLGYENVMGYPGFNGPDMTAEVALDGWKNSTEGHRQVILNQPGPNGDWSQRNWNALGVGIYEGYAVLWFGEEGDPTGEPTRDPIAPPVTSLKPEQPVPPPLPLPPSEPVNVTPPIEQPVPPPPPPPPPIPGVTPPTEQPVPAIPEVTPSRSETTTIPLQGIYRFFDTLTGTHFYTASPEERDNIRNSLPQYNYEGSSFSTPAVPTSETAPIHRFFNTQTGTHFFTISEQEMNQVRSTLPQYNYEGVAYQAYPESGLGTTPLYRFFNAVTGTHFYTPSAEERDVVMESLPNYNYEGVAYHVFAM